MNLLLTGACGRGKWLALFVLLWGNIVAKSEWGTKRTCPSCGARFYDLQRSPVPCPKCAAEFNSDQGQRSRRPKVSAPPKPPPEKPPPEKPSSAASDDANGAKGGDGEAVVGDTAVKDADDADDGPGPIEDTSALGGDEDDVSAVRGRGPPDKASD